MATGQDHSGFVGERNRFMFKQIDLTVQNDNVLQLDSIDCHKERGVGLK